MGIVSSGFFGRGRRDDPTLPPGQHLTDGFPVLSAGPTPRITPEEWEFTITTETGQVHRWSWTEFLALQQDDVSRDIHCVTSWSKLGTSWRGVSLDTLFESVESDCEFTMAHSYGGYTTNVPLDDLLDGKAWIAHEFDGEALEPAHGGPARLLVPHLYFWKSAKWVRGLEMLRQDEPGFWESNGYHMYGDPWREERYW
ncbi:sulfite oxidase-like oxidoreductase [Cryobacterium sp. LW097]|uniref:sulfite oxidase-like oxidoreductase n=1 Tax=unclassified Cryobacterium TaxID=2649013 RepID=UPI000B4D9571|nr:MULTISPECIES: sulfite oxidase-like oxidoreductase [unclassified Cryobacterium]ASD22714.1 sulfite oxidase-like oxidoreductase [Cryobacterium sp. LW097]TFC57662.1 sulfite oxidase-like oxidoreductase [Cryobacterium sp. TMB1-7]TFC88932.1 sulfite oxidase-like oxidoreductase [Cryobacterium sp. TMT4-31]